MLPKQSNTSFSFILIWIQTMGNKHKNLKIDKVIVKLVR